MIVLVPMSMTMHMMMVARVVAVIVSTAVRVIMAVIMAVVMAVMVVAVVSMIVDVMRWFFATQQAQKGTALNPKQPQADQHDQRIAHNLNHTDRVAHRLCGRAQKRGGDADNRDGRKCLKNRRGEGQHDASAPGFVVCNQVRRDDRLAVTGA